MSSAEEAVIKDISDTLEPVVLLIKTLSKSDCSYDSSEKVIDFVLQRLDKNQYSQFSKDLFDRIKNRIIERRNIQVATASAWLNRQMCFGDKPKYLEYADKESTLSFLKDLWERHFCETDETNSISSSEGSIDQSATLEEQFASHMSKKEKLSLSNSLDNEFDSFMIGSDLGNRLKLLKDALKSISPTSTEAERCFSIAGNFVRQRRNRISDELLDSIVILRSKFII